MAGDRINPRSKTQPYFSLIGTHWRHHLSKDVYVITGVGIDEETCETQFEYMTVQDHALDPRGPKWHRKVDRWFDKVEVNGRTFQRFTRVTVEITYV